MVNEKNKIWLYLAILIFAGVGIYLTFFAGNMSKFDSSAKAYRIYPGESYSDDSTIYQPIYYFRVDGREYECQAKVSSSTYPNEKNNTVYYSSDDPTNCKTEYDKSTNKLVGIIFLVVTAIIIYFFIIRKPTDNDNNYGELNESESQLSEEATEKVLQVVNRAQLIYKRIILGIVILILLVFILIDTALYKQTIKAKNYVETTAVYVGKIDDNGESMFNDYTYTFTDKNGIQQEITISVGKEMNPDSEIIIKYNENDPQDFYEEGALLDKKEMRGYIIKIVVMVLLIILFFNKKLLSKLGFSFK